MANEIQDFFYGMPFLTRIWFTGSVVLPLLGRVGVLSPFYMVLSWEHLYQIWRPVTAVLYYPITPQTGFHYLMNLYFLYSYSVRLETGHYPGRPAEYAFLLLFNWIALVLIGLFWPLYLLMDPMVISVIYIWCQLNRDQIVSFWFGTRFKAAYLPWVLLAFNMIISGGGTNEIIGILVGHLYYFLQYKYPAEYGGATLISVPPFLYRLLPGDGRGPAPVDATGDRPGGQPRSMAHMWGRGNSLGGN